MLMQKYLILGILLILGAYFWYGSQKPQVVTNQTTVSGQPQATASSSIKPSPTPLPIPKHSGRQIRVPILTYHYIGNNPDPNDKYRDNLQVTPDKFESQMNYLATNGYNPITLDTLYAALKGGLLPPKPVVLTFDDGYIDFYVNGFPILSRFGFKAVSFIPTALIGQSYYMSWNQIKEINASNLVAFEAHSVNHLNLVSIPSDQVKYQIRESKKVLEEQLGKSVNFFAYPYGLSDEGTWQKVLDAGFLGGVGTWYGNVESEGNVFDMPRIKISGEMDLTTFVSRL